MGRLMVVQALHQVVGMHQHVAASSDPTMWYLTRASAATAYAALSVAVWLGILRTIARKSAERLSWVVDELHQSMATLAGVLIAAHLITLVLDPFLPFTVANLFIPINEPYRRMAVNLGVFALYAMGVVLLTSWLRRRLRYRLWRGVHYISFVAFVLVTVHGFMAGSDSAEPWMRVLYLFGASATVFLTLVRIFVGAPAASGQSNA